MLSSTVSKEDWIGVASIFIFSLVLVTTSLAWQAFGPNNIPSQTIHIEPREALALARSFAQNYSSKVVDPGSTVYITAIQWAFIPNKIVLKAGAKYRFVLSAYDVVHGFSLIGSDGTVYNFMLMPGMAYVVEIGFNKPGIYEVRCNEYCGIGHQDMIMRIEVVG
ncbi:MAG TPA: hypothetical protein VNL13_09460 [Sulfolobales archaeon]|nr:hypothetical protein [Sulfolobales archaeon]